MGLYSFYSPKKGNSLLIFIEKYIGYLLLLSVCMCLYYVYVFFFPFNVLGYTRQQTTQHNKEEAQFTTDSYR